MDKHTINDNDMEKYEVKVSENGDMVSINTLGNPRHPHPQDIQNNLAPEDALELARVILKATIKVVETIKDRSIERLITIREMQGLLP